MTENGVYNNLITICDNLDSRYEEENSSHAS